MAIICVTSFCKYT